jgi:outer membrane protein assembly factor BamC
MPHVTSTAHRHTFRCGALAGRLAAAAALAGVLAGCSSFQQVVDGDRIDYKSASRRTAPLDIPPDLTQLSRDPRYPAPSNSGTVTASDFQTAQPAAAKTPTVSPDAVGDTRIERAGNERWLVTNLTPEQVWPRIRSFWEERGLALAVDEPQTGIMETDWAENRAKIPQDFIRRTIGRVFDPLYSTGERDKFRTRVERTPNGTEVFISHRGMEEVYTNPQRDSTTWQPRASDPLLEAEMLSRLMVRLGSAEAPTQSAGAPTAEQVAANATAGPPRARVVSDQGGAALQVDEGFDRAWRRVGLALDRTGFTVEDRDRAGGLYFVRYMDPAKSNKEEPGWFSRMFGADRAQTAPERYRIAVKPAGEGTLVSVLDAQGSPESGAIGKRIVGLLVEDLK